MRRSDWQPIVELLDAVASRPGLVEEAVLGVREHVVEIGRLPAVDVARHTRALLAAAARSIAERRGPSPAELDFIEGLAVARARQQVPIQAVLGAIDLAGRAVWRDARRLAAERAIPAELLLDARELYDQWAEAVRMRLLVAHREAELTLAQSLREERVALLRQALAGGPGAGPALAEAGLPAGAACWVVHAGPVDPARTARLETALRTRVADLFGVVDDALVGVTAARPEPGELDGPVGVAGPVEPPLLVRGAAWARQAWQAGDALGRRGLVDVDRVGVAAALLAATDLADHLAASRLAALDGEGAFAAVLTDTVAVWVELGADVTATAAARFVHPNTVRHRLRRFASVTDLDLDDPFDRVAAWWLARARAGV